MFEVWDFRMGSNACFRGRTCIRVNFPRLGNWKGLSSPIIDLSIYYEIFSS